jgi:transcriptional regulator with XRE-family HTH domain
LHTEAPDKGIPYDHIAEALHRPLNNRAKSERKIFLETYGGHICARRGKRTFETISQLTGLSVATLKKIEKGETEPSFDTSWRLASVFGVMAIRGDRPRARQH